MSKEFPDDTFLARWLSGDLSEKELQELKEREDYPILKKILEESKNLTIDTFDKKKVWDNISKEIKPKVQPQRKRIPIFRWAAAAAMLVFALWYFIPKEQVPNVIVETSKMEQEAVTLPDNSSVTLNSSSRLEYSEKKWNRDRSLKLDGEAFFDVEEGGKFLVTTPDGEVEVLGTEFNVRSRDEILEVICYSGKVAVSRMNVKEKVVLEKGGSLRLFADGKQESMSNLKNNEPAWKRGFSEFSNASFPTVLEEMQRHFELEIRYSGLEDRFFSGSFPHDDLSLALQAVFQPMDIEYELNGSILTVRK